MGLPSPFLPSEKSGRLLCTPVLEVPKAELDGAWQLNLVGPRSPWQGLELNDL